MAWFRTLSVSAFLLALCGCFPVGSESAVFGSYELGSGNRKITLAINQDHTYEETVLFDAAVKDRRSGKWRWQSSKIDFDSLWIPTELAPDYIRLADAQAKPGEPRYTEPGHWILAVERHISRVVLVVFPDADVTFTKVR